MGKNLTYVSQLDGLDFERYSGVVLPRVLEQVIGCRDDIAQQYLMQALIQVRAPLRLRPRRRASQAPAGFGSAGQLQDSGQLCGCGIRMSCVAAG